MTPLQATTVWISPSASSYSCLCEVCLEGARTAGLLFADALMVASVRGAISPDVGVSSRRCSAGHEIVLRRIERPESLPRHDARQLALS
jgi:hypothetical protein